MKKLLGLISVGFLLTACGEAEVTEEQVEDSEMYEETEPGGDGDYQEDEAVGEDTDDTE